MRKILPMLSMFLLFGCFTESNDIQQKTPMALGLEAKEFTQSQIYLSKQETSETILNKCAVAGVYARGITTKIIKNTNNNMDSNAKESIITGAMGVTTQLCVREVVDYFSKLSDIKDDSVLVKTLANSLQQAPKDNNKN